MGTKANRDSGISSFVEDLLEREGLDLFEKWFEQLKKTNPPDQKVTDFAVRDEMLGEISSLVTQDNSLILGKKDKLLIEDLLNRFLLKAHLLRQGDWFKEMHGAVAGFQTVQPEGEEANQQFMSEPQWEALPSPSNPLESGHALSMSPIVY